MREDEDRRSISIAKYGYNKDREKSNSMRTTAKQYTKTKTDQEPGDWYRLRNRKKTRQKNEVGRLKDKRMKTS